MSRSRRGIAAHREYLPPTSPHLVEIKASSEDSVHRQTMSLSRSKKVSDGDDLKISAKLDEKCDPANINSTSTKRKRGNAYKSDCVDTRFIEEVNENRDAISLDSTPTKRKRTAYKSDCEDVKMSAKSDDRTHAPFKSDGEDVKINADPDQKCDVMNMNSTSTKRKRMAYKYDCDDVKISTDTQCDVNMINMNPSNDTADDEIKTCSICLEIPQEFECTKLDGCKHLFCFGCIDKWSQRENTCPLCKVRFNKIERLLKTDGKGKKRRGQDAASSKKIKNRDQSADLYDHSSIQSLFASLHASGALPPHIADALFSARGLLQGNPFAAARTSSRIRNNGIASSTSDSTAPVIVSVRQTSYMQRGAPAFFHFENVDSDIEDDGIGFFPAVISRSFRISTTGTGGNSSMTVDLSSSPQRSYSVRGQGNAERPLEIADSDED